MSERPSEQLARQLLQRQEQEHGVDLNPSSAYEAVTRQMVEDLGEQLRDLRSRIDWLIFIVISAILIQFAGQLMAA